MRAMWSGARLAACAPDGVSLPQLMPTRIAAGLLFALGVSAAFVLFGRGSSLLAPRVEASIAKWHDGHAAAISVTYDSGSPESAADRQVQDFVVANALHLDYEVVTANYLGSAQLLAYLQRELLPRGFGFFGHGHQHVDHDALSYDEALRSFRACRDAMLQLGLEPVAYAYPYGAGHRPRTRRALADAGFLSGRMHDPGASRDPFIVPDASEAPRDWYKLPSLVMQDYRFAQCQRCVSGTRELIPFLDGALQKHAWLILTYHGIGDESQWGWYEMSDFTDDMRAIAQRDFWSASLDAITLYVRERSQATLRVTSKGTHGIVDRLNVQLSDALPATVFHQPLTILLHVPPQWIGRTLAVRHRHATVGQLQADAEEVRLSLVPDDHSYQLTPVGVHARPLEPPSNGAADAEGARAPSASSA